MLFAQAAGDPNWSAGSIIQYGALAILGYHLLIGLPRMIAQLNASQLSAVQLQSDQSRDERQSFEKRCLAMCMAIEKLAAAMPLACQFRLGRGDEPEGPQRFPRGRPPS